MEFRSVKLGSIEYRSGQKKTFDVSRDGVLTALYLRLRFTITENNSAALAGPRFQTLARLVRRFDFVMGGRDTIISQSGEMLAARAQYEHGTQPDGMGDTVVLTQNTATSYDVTIPIPMTLPRSTNPLMTAADLRRVTQSTIEITWANENAQGLFNTAANATISNVTCDVEADYFLDMPGDFQPMVRELFIIEEDYSAASQNMGVTIDGRSSRLLRSVALSMTDNLVGSNALLNTILIQSGAFKWHDNDGPALQARNKLQFEQEAEITGFYYLPLTAFGDPGFLINTAPSVRAADVQAVMDVSTGSGDEKAVFSVEAVRPLIRG